MSQSPTSASGVSNLTGEGEPVAINASSLTPVTYDAIIVRSYIPGARTKQLEWHVTKFPAPWTLESRVAITNCVTFRFGDSDSRTFAVRIKRIGRSIDKVDATFSHRDYISYNCLIVEDTTSDLTVEFKHM